MSIKTLLLIGCACMALPGCVAMTEKSQEAEKTSHDESRLGNGRYRVVTLENGHSDKKQMIEWSEQIVMKVDTATGEAWILLNVTNIPGRDEDENDHSKSWVPIPEYIPGQLNAKPRRGVVSGHNRVPYNSN